MIITPNDCENVVKIKGPKALLDEISRRLSINNSEDPFDLLADERTDRELILDYMDDSDSDGAILDSIKKTLGRSFESDIYKSNFDNLRTYYFFGHDYKDGEITFGYGSAWSPSRTLVEYIIKRWAGVSVEGKYYEPGCNFIGCMSYERDDEEDIDNPVYEIIDNCYDLPSRCISFFSIDNATQDVPEGSSQEQALEIFNEEFRSKGCDGCHLKDTEVCRLIKEFKEPEGLYETKEKALEEFLKMIKDGDA